MKKILVLAMFLVVLNINAAECSFTAGLTTVSASFYWNYDNDGCWVTSSKFYTVKSQQPDGLICKIKLKNKTEYPYGMGDIIYHSQCGYGSHPNYPTANNVLKVVVNGSDGIPSYRLKVTPDSTRYQRWVNVGIDDLVTNVCPVGSYYEYDYVALNDSSESGASTTTEIKTVGGCYVYSLYNTMWNYYFFNNIDKKELRYILFNGQLIPVYLWVDTETLSSSVYKAFHVYIPKFFDGGVPDKGGAESESEDPSELISNTALNTVADIYEKELDKKVVELNIDEKLDSFIKDIFSKTGGHDLKENSVITTAINENAEIIGIGIEKMPESYEKESELQNLIEDGVILSFDGFSVADFKDVWDMVEFALSNEISEMELFKNGEIYKIKGR